MITLTRRAALRTALAGSAGLTLAPRAFAAGHGRIGTFSGRSDHVASGRVEVVGSEIAFLADFRFDGAPDPKVAMGRGGYDPATLAGALRSDRGAQSYALPAGLDSGDYDEVWIWCARFAVPLALARLP